MSESAVSSRLGREGGSSLCKAHNKCAHRYLGYGSPCSSAQHLAPYLQKAADIRIWGHGTDTAVVDRHRVPRAFPLVVLLPGQVF